MPDCRKAIPYVELVSTHWQGTELPEVRGGRRTLFIRALSQEFWVGGGERNLVYSRRCIYRTIVTREVLVPGGWGWE